MSKWNKYISHWLVQGPRVSCQHGLFHFLSVTLNCAEIRSRCNPLVEKEKKSKRQYRGRFYCEMKRAVHRFPVDSVDSREGGLSRGKKRGTILEYLAVFKLYSVLLDWSWTNRIIWISSLIRSRGSFWA